MLNFHTFQIVLQNNSPDYLKLSRYFLYLVTFNKVAFLNVIVIFKGNTALITFFDFLNVFLKAFQLSDRTVMNNHIVAQQTDFGTALDHTFGNHTARNFADAGNIVNFANFGITENFFAQLGRQH